MIRYQVLIDAEQKRRLERIAEKQRRSAASVLRQALDIGLEVLEKQERGDTPPVERKDGDTS